MRSRSLVGLGAVAALALTLGWVLSLATTRVKNWFVMSDELYYERLAISVAQTGSLLPRVHGEIVSNVNQLYPVLLSTVYGSGNVPASLEGAHRLNAFLIATAAIPVYLLARRLGVGTILAVAAGGLAAAVPWVVLSSFLLTEVVAYPAFCWALLALVHAVERKTWVWDAVALVAIAVAALARTQFVVLVGVLLVAVAAEAVLTVGARGAAAELWRTRRPLVLLYAALLAVVLVAFATGNGSRLLGSYAVTAENVRLDLDLVELTFAHVATIALGLAILPFVVGLGWLIDRIRPSAAPSERAFALVGASAFVLLAVQVASFTQRFGAGLVKDRYLFYVAPIVIVALAAAIGSRTWPRWWALAVPAAVAAVGFAWIPVTPYEKLNVDTPVAMLNDALLDLATSETWARVLLVLLTAVVLQALLLARPFLPWRPVAVAVAAIALVALPLETAYAFERLFRVNGTNGLPITLDQGVVFNWIDRNVGADGRVTVVKYPVGGPDWWAGQALLVGRRVLERERGGGHRRHVPEGQPALVDALRPTNRPRAPPGRHPLRRRLRAGRAIPTRGPPAPLRARRVPVRSGTSMARGLGRLGHLRRRLVAAAGSSHVHRLRAAGAELTPGPRPDARRLDTERCRQPCRDDPFEPRAVDDDHRGRGVVRASDHGVRPAGRDRPRRRRVAGGLAHVPRPDEGGPHRRDRPADELPPAHRRACRRNGPAEALPGVR